MEIKQLAQELGTEIFTMDQGNLAGLETNFNIEDTGQWVWHISPPSRPFLQPTKGQAYGVWAWVLSPK